MRDVSSTHLTAVPVRALPVVPELADVQSQTTSGAAISLCATKSGQLDKVIAAELHIDGATWSRWKSGLNSPSLEQLCELMDLCGNESPLHWLLLRRGYDPRRLQRLETELEQENRLLRERLAMLEAEREVERRYARDLLGDRS